jgi:hypothetical protein
MIIEYDEAANNQQKSPNKTLGLLILVRFEISCSLLPLF